jgi:hypothetical protein
MVPIRESGKGSPMTKPKILITKAERAEFARDAADEKYLVKLTKAIRDLADANTAFDVFCNTDFDFSTITGTKACPPNGYHPQDAAYAIVRETLRDNLMAMLNHVAYLDEEEASYRMSSRIWANEDCAKHPDRFTGTSPKR